MKGPLRICHLVRDLREELALEWLAGQRHAQRPLQEECPDGPSTENEPARRLRLIGCDELEDPRAPLPQLQEDPRFLDPGIAALLLSGDCRPAPEALKRADDLPFGLLFSPKARQFVGAEVHHYLNHHLAEHCTRHGVFMEVHGVGVLLEGSSGVGKSELALEMLTRGHRLVADDTPLFAHIQPHALSGTSPPVLQGFLEVRGMGVLNVRRLFGHSALKHKKNLQLIIELRRMEDAELLAFDRLHGSRLEVELLGLTIPKVILPVTPGRELAILVETAVRQHINRRWGYDAADDFSARQARLLNDDGTR